MARALTSVPETDAPNAEYPSGRIRNEDSPIVGTPVIEELYGDIIQFFHKLIRLGGVTLNGLPESETNTFQLIEALQLYIRSVSGNETLKGVWQAASNAETQAGLLSTKIVTPASLESKTATTTRKGILETSTDAETQAGTSAIVAVTPASLQSCTATQARKGIAEVADYIEIEVGTDNTRMVTPLGLSVKDGGIKRKIMNIGAWNMDSTSLISVAHGLTFANIRSAKAFVYDDASSYCKDVLSGDNANYVGSVSWDATNINLFRGSLFDTTDFNNAVMNRGFITIEYTP